MMKHKVWVVVAMVGALLTGCASAGRSSGKEPAYLAVVNMTGAAVKVVTISKPGDKPGEGRYGSISPVPAGMMQLVERSGDRRDLPSEIQVSWISAYGKQQTREVPLRDARQQATGAEGEALVVELRADGSAVAVIKLLH